MKKVKYIQAVSVENLEKLVQAAIDEGGSADGPPISFNGMIVQKVVW